MKKSLIISCVLVIISFLSSAQKFNYSFKLSPNITYIDDIKAFPISIDQLTGDSYTQSNYYILEKYSSKLGGLIGGNLNFFIGTSFFLEGGIQLSLLRYNRFTEIHDVANTNLEESSQRNDYAVISIEQNYSGSNMQQMGIEEIKRIGNVTILYTGIPVQIGYSLFDQKLKIKLGFMTTYASYALVYTQIAEKVESTETFTSFLWNGTLEIEYAFYRNLGFNLNYTRSLNSFYNENVSIGSPKYNVFSVGLTYSFLK